MWVCIAFFLLAPTALAADVPATSGTCGNSATWSYDQTTKTLTISGSGAIELWDIDAGCDFPWQWRAEIEKVEFAGSSFTAIGDYAFSGFSKLTNISIPNGVTSIGEAAFGNCTNLEEAIIPEGVTTLGYRMFVECGKLSHVVIPASLTAGGGYWFAECGSLTSAGPKGSDDYSIEFGWTDTIPGGAFAWCRSLAQVTLPDSIKTIADDAFCGCWSLTQFTFPDNIKTIGRKAFSYTGLTQIIIPDTVTEIGDEAFAGAKLTKLTIPGSVTKLGYNVFGWCQNLSHVVIQADASALGTGSSVSNHPLYDGRYNSFETGDIECCPMLTSVGPIGSGSNIEINWSTIPARAFAGCIRLQTITIPETVRTIGDEAFNTCTGLTQITIPDAVTTIGSRAISYCPNLKTLNIPDSVIRINNGHDGMFGGCTNLETITVDPENTIYTAQDGALFSKEKTTLYCVPRGKSGFMIPAGVNKIENGTFSGCTKLTEINIPSGVTEIGYDAFTDCSGLTKLVIPDGVTSNFFDFRGCTALTEVTLPGSANYYSGINGPSLTTVRILEGTKEISGTFSGVTTLTDVYLPASLTHINQNTFANCSNLKNVYFAGTQAQWNALTIADGNQELSLATVVCTGASENPPVDPDNPDTPAPPETLGITAAPGGLGQRLTVQVQSGHWLTIQTRRAGSIAISSIQAPTSAGGMVTVAFSAPSGSIVQVWETENELTFVNGVPTNPILKTVVKEL